MGEKRLAQSIDPSRTIDPPCQQTGPGVVAAPLLTTRSRYSAEGLNSWIEVDPGIFERNLELIEEMLADGTKVCAVMKADAYGAGIDLLIRQVIRARVSYVGIASNDEARIVRANGFNGFKGKLMRVRMRCPMTSRSLSAV